MEKNSEVSESNHVYAIALHAMMIFLDFSPPGAGCETQLFPVKYTGKILGVSVEKIIPS